MLLTISVFGPNARAQVSQVPIVNPSFETNVTADGTRTNGLLTGWTASNQSQPYGAANPTQGVGGQFPSDVPDGSNAAYITTPFLTVLYQTLTTTLAANTVYSLTAYVGASATEPFFGSYQLTLGVSGFGGSTLIASNSPGLTYVPIPAGTFVPITLSYNSQTGNQSLIGQPLTILFSESGFGNGTNSTAYLDNVTLRTVPEPGTWTLLAAGALGVGGTVWKRRR